MTTKRKVENNRTKKLKLSFSKRNLLEEETLTSLDSTCLRKSRHSEGGPVLERALHAHGLGGRKDPFC